MALFYISCDTSPTINGAVLECPTADGAQAYTEQAIYEFYNQRLTPSQSLELMGPSIGVLCLAWGYSQLSRLLERR